MSCKAESVDFVILISEKTMRGKKQLKIPQQGIKEECWNVEIIRNATRSTGEASKTRLKGGIQRERLKFLDFGQEEVR